MRKVPFVDAREWDERYREKPILWGAEPNRLFAEIVSELKPGRALDLAAGEGRNSIWLATEGWDATAVDFSSVAVKRGRAMAAESGVEVDFVAADVLTYEPAAEAFDLVAIVYLHLQATDRRAVLARSERALKPGGSIVIVGHDLRNLDEGVGGPQDPAVLMSPDALVEELGGCEILRGETVRRDVPDHGGIALDTVVVAKRPRPT